MTRFDRQHGGWSRRGRRRVAVVERGAHDAGAALERPLNRLAQIHQQMKAVGDLRRGWGRRGDGLRIGGGAVPADDLDAGPQFHQ
jgi:hypothetical protein